MFAYFWQALNIQLRVCRTDWKEWAGRSRQLVQSVMREVGSFGVQKGRKEKPTHMHAQYMVHTKRGSPPSPQTLAWRW